MPDQADKARSFTALHRAGEPLLIYNVWDGGSAKAVAAAGAKALATGDHPVGYAHGFGDDDFDDFTFDIYEATIREIAARTGELPFSVDISNADGLGDDALRDRIKLLLDIGVIGINFEDRTAEGLLPAEDQAHRIQVIREAATEAGIPLFINARSDLFAQADPDSHAGLLDEAVQRAAAYRAAGADGFFVPGLMDIELIKQLCDRVELPVNIIRLPGAPETADLAAAGVSRVSYGPVPQMQMTKWLTEQATQAFNY